ncbi:Sensor histidine kinase YesM [Pseudobutyrivibrio sp. UC1225]|uniref:GHKL domain-containing protein n=1 Tax=Pseudobutyrivibrio sp. UC1225 TaxID=1798185 RepID=UPI0008E540E3|nr:GHKL domain-containing protein [Pseudobutyrivibrio sp. UC1225]SFO03819.1 Sensor histidine kinase YesM [Pseudobutyrivibrio sp. UC1225]
MKELCFFFIYFSEAIILALYCNSLFEKRYSKVMVTGMIAVTYIVLYSISFFNNPYLNLSAFIITNYICMLLLYKSTPTNTLFHLLIITVTMLVSEVLSLAIFTNIANNLFYEKDTNNTSLLLASLLSKLLYFLITNTIAKSLKTKKLKNIPKSTENIFLSLVPILSIGILITFFSISIFYPNLPHMLTIMLFISAFFILLINLIIYGVYEYIGKNNEAIIDLQLQILREQDKAEYYKKLVEQDENQKIIIHDIKKHLQAIAILNESSDSAKISNYLEHIINSSAMKTPVKICNHAFLNSILSHYKREAESYNISINFDIRNHCIDFLPEDSITTLFCNLLENAIEASRNTVDAFIDLSASIKENTCFTTITLQNSCANNPFSPEGLMLKSPKNDSKLHGFGLKSINKLVTNYDGSMKCFYDDSTHTFHTIIFLSNKCNI